MYRPGYTVDSVLQYKGVALQMSNSGSQTHLASLNTGTSASQTQKGMEFEAAYCGFVG